MIFEDYSHLCEFISDCLHFLEQQRRDVDACPSIDNLEVSSSLRLGEVRDSKV